MDYMFNHGIVSKALQKTIKPADIPTSVMKILKQPELLLLSKNQREDLIAPLTIAFCSVALWSNADSDFDLASIIITVREKYYTEIVLTETISTATH